MLKRLGYLLVITVVLGFSFIGYAGDNSEEGEVKVESYRVNPETGEEEMYHIEEGKYFKVIDGEDEIRSKAEEELSYGKIEEPPVVPFQAGHGVCYTKVEYEGYNIRSGNKYGVQGFMILHSSGIYSTSSTNSWFYTPSHAPFNKSCELLMNYPGSSSPGLWIYDWAKPAANRWVYIGSPGSLSNYKTWVSDGFGNQHACYYFSNEVRFNPSNNSWWNEVYLWNGFSMVWVLVYSYNYTDYTITEEWSWGGVWEYETTENGGNSPAPLKASGFIKLMIIKENMASYFDGVNDWFSNYNPPNNMVINNRKNNYTWVNGAVYSAD